MDLNNLFQKKIGIFGLGTTGVSVYEYLKTYTHNIICWDDSENNRKKFTINILKKIEDKSWLDLDIIIISPGVSHDHDIFKLAQNYNIRISSDIELFLIKTKDKPVIAVTGTNGKSTTVSLIHHILNQSGKKYVLGGNIGEPVLSLSEDVDGYIVELSSFQLDLLKEINLSISVLLNITPDHLDRYASYQEYYESKLKIFNHDNIKIIGIDNLELRDSYIKLSDIFDKNKIIPISSNHKMSNNVISYEDNVIEDTFLNNTTYKTPNFSNLLGPHNRQNIAASFAVCRLLGLKPEEIINHILSFKALKHRMQYLGIKNGVKYYNDSKATNCAAVICALDSIENIYWLAGGVFKEDGFSLLDNKLGHVEKAYLYGKSKGHFASYLKDKINYEIFDTMQDAFMKAKYDAENNDNSNILLSPACSSFDQFKNFQDRGDKFIELYKDEK